MPATLLPNAHILFGQLGFEDIELVRLNGGRYSLRLVRGDERYEIAQVSLTEKDIKAWRARSG